MTLVFLLDEHLSPDIAAQITRLRREIGVESVVKWQGGSYRETADTLILRAARAAGLTLITYDQRTITPVLEQWAEQGEWHAGVVFVSHRTVPSHDIGALVQGLIRLWDTNHDADWTNRVEFLRAVRR